MFERFTAESKAVLTEAQDVALELGSRYIGAIHLLYGCAEGREATAGEPLRQAGVTAASIRRLLPHTEEKPAGEVDPNALRAVGIDYDEVRRAVEATFGPGALQAAPDRRASTTTTRKPPFTPEAKRSLELASRAAKELHQHTMRPGHLLLGLLRLDSDLVTLVVDHSDADLAGLTAAVHVALSTAAAGVP
ncbi:MAG: Clp protease N-terminal domain-containing protein [Acidimicrobiales bacterium]